MTNRFPDVVISITASSWAGFAIWLGTDPGALLPAFGVDASTPQMLTEVRAFYGGVELAIAISMIVLWRRKQQFAALLIGGLPLVGSACGRLSGLALDGFSTMHLGFASLELLGASFCAAAAILLRRHNSPSQIGSDHGSHDAIK
ncbi:MAG: DUF4345 family protein [Planctomycetota bacterium]